MPPRESKTCYFIIEGLNSFSTVYYTYYFYFFMEQKFGFGNKANLALAALIGGWYALMAWGGGLFSQRFGYFTALKAGFTIMAVAVAIGSQLGSATGQILAILGMVIGMCLTWPTLEALVAENETPAGLQRMVGIYNVVWATTGSVAYFTGGLMLEKLGLQSMFFVPIAFFVVQLAVTFWQEAHSKTAANSHAKATSTPSSAISGHPNQPHTAVSAAVPLSPGRRKMFVRLAWLANPLGYIAINTLIAVMPGLANRLGLTTTQAGFCASVWCFARLGSFAFLWLWTGWHYRFRWLLTAYITMILTFAMVVMAPNVAVLVVAQVILGIVLGLLYYSSLFYSMDGSDTKGEHGGIHEAAIGLGNFAGPAVGAASLHFLPQYANSGALAVCALLTLGLGGLLAIWRAGKAEAG
jgi:predicted MFS family arabinose efflux permease